MADVKLSHVYKVYDGNVKAVNDFNIDIKDKEFIVFVGPSGCGKSTTLRMIAGLEDISAGDLFIQDQLVNDVQPKDRDIAMVFQNYALYPHMTVYENMAFSLKNRHMPKEEINRRVLEAARILDIEDFLQRKPKAMSGGQRQRVSLGRAIVRQPKVFLLDEPLSNLDAKLRAQMRTEIAKLHKRLQTTFIYVTHDQVEAMTMGTRIVVMKLGFVQQIDTPTNLYNHPINKFVAGFIGTPQMNFFDVTLLREKSNVTITFEDKQTTTMSMLNFFKANPEYLKGDIHVTLGVRPDALLITKEKNGIELIVTEIEALGNETLLYCDLANAVVKDKEKIGKSSIIVKVDASSSYHYGDKIKVKLADNRIHLFDNETEQTVMPFIPKSTHQTISFKGDSFTLFGKTYKRFQAWRDIKDGENYHVEIPHSAIVPGKAYTLDVVSCDPIDNNKYLIVLENKLDESYVTVTTDLPHEVGDSLSFGIKYADLILDSELNCPPVIKECSILGSFKKVKEIDDKDYNYVNSKVQAQKQRVNLEKQVSKFYLSSEEFGANELIHTKVKDLFNENLVTENANVNSLLDETNTLREEILSLQKEEVLNEDRYIEIKKELLTKDKLIAQTAFNALANALKVAKEENKDFALLSSDDLERAKVNINKVIEAFENETKVTLENIFQEKREALHNKAIEKLNKKLNKVFTSNRLFAGEESVPYLLDRTANYKQTDKYTRLMKETPSEIFTDNPPSDVSSEKVSQANTKLYNEIVQKYLLAISATESYIRGLFLGNSTRWHAQADANADEIFKLFTDLFDKHLEDFKLCNKKHTKDYKLKKVSNFYIDLCGTMFKLSDEIIARLTNIEGSKLLKNNYRFVIKPVVKNLHKPNVKAVNEVNIDGKQIDDTVTDTTSITTKLPSPEVMAEDLSTTEIRQLSKQDIDAEISKVDMVGNIKHTVLNISNYEAHTFARVEFHPDFINETNIDKFDRQYADIEITGLDVADDYYITADQKAGFEVFTLDSKIRII